MRHRGGILVLKVGTGGGKGMPPRKAWEAYPGRPGGEAYPEAPAHPEPPRETRQPTCKLVLRGSRAPQAYLFI